MVMVDPVRILDTRDPVNVGLSGPFVSAISQKLQVSGSVPTTAGTQIVVPIGATGVLLNVTAVGASADGFISIRPGDATGSPATSSLNVTAGVTVPNAVQVALPITGTNAGKIDISWDALGVAGPTTDILIDVVGYTTRDGLQELVNAQPIARSARDGSVGALPDNNGSVALSVTVDVPVAGLIQINASAYIDDAVTAGTYTCMLTLGTGNTSNAGDLQDTDRIVEVIGPEGAFCATNGALAVSAGTHVINLVLRAPDTALSSYDDATLDAIFVADGTITSA